MTLAMLCIIMYDQWLIRVLVGGSDSILVTRIYIVYDSFYIYICIYEHTYCEGIEVQDMLIF